MHQQIRRSEAGACPLCGMSLESLQPAGILTDRDIKLILGPDFGSPDERELKVRDAFVEQPCIVPLSAPVGKVAKMMADRHIGSAIVTKNDKLVGIFTVTDACRALARVLGEN